MLGKEKQVKPTKTDSDGLHLNLKTNYLKISYSGIN